MTMALHLDLSASSFAQLLPRGKPVTLSLGKRSSKLYNQPTFSKFLDISTAHHPSGPAFVMNMVVALTLNISVSTPSFRAFVRPRTLQWTHTSLGSTNSYRNSNTTNQPPFLHFRTMLSTYSSFNRLAMTEIGSYL